MAAVSRAVVGHYPLDLTPRPANQASARSRNGTALSLRSSDSTLAVRHPRGVIDIDVDVFPAGTAPVVAAIAGDPVSDRLNPFTGTVVCSGLDNQGSDPSSPFRSQDCSRRP